MRIYMTPNTPLALGLLIIWLACGALGFFIHPLTGLLYFALTGGVGWLEWRAQDATVHNGRHYRRGYFR